MQYRSVILVVITSLITSVVVTGLLVTGYWYLGKDQLVLDESAKEQSAITETDPKDFYGVARSEIVPAVVAQVNEAVVSVVVTKDVPIYERYYEQFDPWGGLWGDWGGFAVPRIREYGREEREVGGGSGFIVSPDGLVVTNRHVVDDTEARYSILTNQGDSYEVEVLARDPQLDIAILKIVDAEAPATLPYLPFGDSTELRLGESVIAIGNALGEFRNSVSVGVVSGLARSIVATDARGRSERMEQVIQTDAAINPGNSGGPLLNLQGEVIGVNVAVSRGADNIGFALPSQIVETVVDSVRETGRIVRPFLGIRYVMVDERVKNLNNLPVGYGALITRGETREELAIMPGSPAALAGLREGDLILEVDGVRVAGRDFLSLLRTKQVGQTITLKILREGEEQTVSVVLAEAP